MQELSFFFYSSSTNKNKQVVLLLEMQKGALLLTFRISDLHGEFFRSFVVFRVFTSSH